MRYFRNVVTGLVVSTNDFHTIRRCQGSLSFIEITDLEEHKRLEEKWAAIDEMARREA